MIARLRRRAKRRRQTEREGEGRVCKRRRRTQELVQAILRESAEGAKRGALEGSGRSVRTKRGEASGKTLADGASAADLGAA